MSTGGGIPGDRSVGETGGFQPIQPDQDETESTLPRAEDSKIAGYVGKVGAARDALTQSVNPDALGDKQATVQAQGGTAASVGSKHVFSQTEEGGGPSLADLESDPDALDAIFASMANPKQSTDSMASMMQALEEDPDALLSAGFDALLDNAEAFIDESVLEGGSSESTEVGVPEQEVSTESVLPGRAGVPEAPTRAAAGLAGSSAVGGVGAGVGEIGVASSVSGSARLGGDTDLQMAKAALEGLIGRGLRERLVKVNVEGSGADAVANIEFIDSPEALMDSAGGAAGPAFGLLNEDFTEIQFFGAAGILGRQINAVRLVGVDDPPEHHRRLSSVLSSNGLTVSSVVEFAEEMWDELVEFVRDVVKAGFGQVNQEQNEQKESEDLSESEHLQQQVPDVKVQEKEETNRQKDTKIAISPRAHIRKREEQISLSTGARHDREVEKDVKHKESLKQVEDTERTKREVRLEGEDVN